MLVGVRVLSTFIRHMPNTGIKEGPVGIVANSRQLISAHPAALLLAKLVERTSHTWLKPDFYLRREVIT